MGKLVTKKLTEQIEIQTMFWFTVIYMIIFTIDAILKRNYEFLYYTVMVTVLLLVILLYHKKIHLSMHILGGLTLLGAMHIFGGNVYIGAVRLYDFWFIQDILKYDNIVHAFGIFVVTIIAYNLLNPHLDKTTHHHWLLLSLLLVLIASGVGAFNEIFELGAVVFMGAAKGVGDYMNNALDLVFNIIGSIIACIFVLHHRKNNTNVK